MLVALPLWLVRRGTSGAAVSADVDSMLVTPLWLVRLRGPSWAERRS